MPSSTHGVADKIDPYGKINREIAELRKQIAELRAARRLESATIGAGGLTLAGAGGLNVEDTFRNLILGIGALSIPLTGGADQYGLLLNRQNADGTPGASALTMYTGTGAMPQTLGLYDARGNALWTDDAIAQQGIGRPYISFPWAPIPSTLWPSTTAGIWTNLWAASPPKQQPNVYLQGVAITPAGVNGELRLWDAANAVQIGATITVASQPAGLIWTIGPAAVGGNHLDPMQLELQGQITAGTGAISAMIYASYGQQS